LKDYEHKETSTGKPYFKLKISDVDDKVKTLNYFGEALEIKKRCIYVGTLVMKNGWINTAYGTKLIKVN
jgi:hypothetical protein